jgi:NTP pyrophosphatase (non-canonical NTP hydrolase)
MISESGTGRIERIRARLAAFVAEREWGQFHDPKNLAMALVSEAGELAAELRWVATDQADSFVRDPVARERIEREVGDIGIALLLFCERVGLDLLDAIERKIEVNAANYPAEASRGRSERPSAR